MKFTKPVLCLVAVFGTGCAMLPAPAPLAASDMPNCFESNYDAQRGLFTLNSAASEAARQQCLRTVVPRGTNALSSRLAAGGDAGVLAANKARPGNGGGATSLGDGGDGGGGRSRRQEDPPERGTLGSGGGGGIGNETTCEPGARGGHGYIALRAL